MNRRNFIQTTTLAGTATLLPFETPAAGNNLIEPENGNQRLKLQKLQEWERMGYGMFLHFGMSTFDGAELSKGDKPSTFYAPQKVDTDQWIRTARDAGMKYAVLTTKHVSGHCLWPSKYTDYHVGTSGNKTDVVRDFVNSCARYGIMPGFYYCSWDNHHIMGSGTPSYIAWGDAYTTEEYREFQWNQLEELLTQYGEIGEVWIDIPGVLPRDYRQKLYNQIAHWQPESVIMMNHGIGDGSQFKINYAWPTDLIAIERFLPNSQTKHIRLRTIEGKQYYMPGEVCDPIGKEWFFKEGDTPRSDAELLGMYLVSRSRGTNLLLDVPPDKNGVIPKMYVDALMQLRKNLNTLSLNI
ncbi:MAG: alpha-L-fucosidase [Lentimicrobiaceae bacterium]|nr:alpha-L-fucosidase [Lentimicrobiaceae bacterium]